jgi:hypothetical protein
MVLHLTIQYLFKKEHDNLLDIIQLQNPCKRLYTQRRFKSIQIYIKFNSHMISILGSKRLNQCSLQLKYIKLGI